MTEILVAREVVRRYGSTHALDGVDVTVLEGRSVGLAGESGSGKTTLLRQFLGLDRPTDGRVLYRDDDIGSLDRAGRRAYRTEVQAVFQDPGTSLDPRWPIWRSVTEPVAAFERVPRAELRARAADLLRSVGLSDSYVDRLPHQMSGGERQRAAIARALSTNPRVVLLDEPVTALDISVRGSILNLLRQMCEERSTTIVVVSHDVLAIAYLTDEVYVMYRGRVVESGPTLDVLGAPSHPYTELLVRTAEDPLFVQEVAHELPSDVHGCPYRHRCPFATDRCADAPRLMESGPHRAVACHHPRNAAEVVPEGTGMGEGE